MSKQTFWITVGIMGAIIIGLADAQKAVADKAAAPAKI